MKSLAVSCEVLVLDIRSRDVTGEKYREYSASSGLLLVLDSQQGSLECVSRVIRHPLARSWFRFEISRQCEHVKCGLMSSVRSCHKSIQGSYDLK